MIMTLALKIVLASVVLCVLIGIFLAVTRKKALIISLLITALLFTSAASGYAYIEYAAYKKRSIKYRTAETGFPKMASETRESEKEYAGFKYFQEYRNALLGYEFFLLEVGLKQADRFSYQNTIRTNIIQNLRNQEYTESYWNTVFDVVFEFNEEKGGFQRPNYKAMYAIPDTFDQIDSEEEDYGDLEDKENYAFFERSCQLLYLYEKVKAIDRSPEHIADFWNSNKAYVYTFFSKAKYDRLCKDVVDDLVEIHDTITATPEYVKFYRMYDISDEAFLEFPSASYTGSFKYSWPFSFWDRRFAENNADEVYAVLKEIQNHYKN